MEVHYGLNVVNYREAAVLIIDDTEPETGPSRLIKGVKRGLSVIAISAFVLVGSFLAAQNPTAFLIGFTQGYVMTSIAVRR